MKVIERIIKRRLTNLVNADEIQVGLISGIRTIDATDLEKSEMAGRKMYGVLLIWKKRLIVSSER